MADTPAALPAPGRVRALDRRREPTPEELELALQHASQGMTLERIYEQLVVTWRTFNRWLNADEAFKAEFLDARRAGWMKLAEGTLEVAEDEPDVQRARLITENTWKYLSKMDPAKWGEKTHVQLDVAPSLADAINEGIARTLAPAIVTAALPAAGDVHSARQEEPASYDGP